MEENHCLMELESYYRLLNVSKTATLEEISSSYRRLSRMFHPDKHSTNPRKQKWAGETFNKIKKAYEVLSDPEKRAIYDTLGEKGLDVDGWEIVFRTRTPREIRDEYERLKREREERRLQQSANPRGTITLSVNATDLFTKYHDQYEIVENTTHMPSIEVSGMTIQQSIDAPISLRNTTTLTGNISAQNGIGAGTLNISNRHITSEKGWLETELGIGNGPLLGFKIFRTISRHMFLNCGTVLQFRSKGLAPSFVSNVAYQLDAHSVGYLTYNAGSQGSSMTSTYVTDSEKFHTNSALTIGKPHSFVSFSILYKVPQYNIKMRLAMKLGTFGGIAEYGAEKKVSQNSSVSAAVTLGIPSGVTLKLKLTCSSQTITIPIQLSDELTLAPVFYATVVPMVSWLLLKKLILDPIAKERQERERQSSMEANFDRLVERRREASATVELMRETYHRIKSEEESKGGLVILKAWYGKLCPDTSSHEAVQLVGDGVNYDASAQSEIIDVTIPLQSLVKNSRLQLLGPSKSELPGFYNPCVGEEIHLTIKYMYQHQVMICTVSDKEPVTLPQNSSVSGS